MQIFNTFFLINLKKILYICIFAQKTTIMNYEEYYYEVWNWILPSLISDEYFDKNRELFEAITYDLWQEYNQSGAPNPYVGNLMIRIMFSNLQNIGIR